MRIRDYWSASIGMNTRGNVDMAELQRAADELAVREEIPRSFVPAGFGIKPGERVLLAVNSFYDKEVVEVVAKAVVHAGATCDVICTDMGEERELREDDEIRGFIFNWEGYPNQNEVRNWPARRAWVEKVAEEQGYDLLVHGVGQPPVQRNYRSDTLPFTSAECFMACDFPREVWDLVEKKAWDIVWNKGRGGRVHITDPEGTDITFSMPEEYFEPSRYDGSGFAPFFNPDPHFCHLWAAPTPPYSDSWDACGVASGTTNHFSCPYPNIKVYLEHGQVTRVEGGGKYGDEWRKMLEATKDIQYPGYPRKGMFWFFEAGVGTNPKMCRPKNAFMLSGCGTTFERLAAGYVHLGIGTAPLSEAERWAKENGVIHGHLHVHCLNCTYKVIAKDGTVYTMIKDGHLMALDDPEVISCAAKYGDPAEILKEVWKAPYPGITGPGVYEKDYAPDPMKWLKEHGYA